MSFIKNFLTEEFLIAYRLIPKHESNELIFESKTTSFKAINNDKKYWYADPFIFKHNNEVYIFFEAYDRERRKGEIGYCKILGDGNISSKKIVIKEKFHLSYPNIFTINEKIYMIPESSEANKLILYVCISFPDKWCQLKVLIDNIKLVDATFLSYNGHNYLLASELMQDNLHGNRLILYSLDDGFNVKKCNYNPIIEDIALARPGGRIFEYNGKLIRPSQDCSDGNYGRALNFNCINKISEDMYDECNIAKVFPENISLNIRKKLTGTHTYALQDYLEVIDVKYKVPAITLGIKISIHSLISSIFKRRKRQASSY